jgi:hypothetical protein
MASIAGTVSADQIGYVRDNAEPYPWNYQYIAPGMCGRDVKGAMNRTPTVGEMVRTFKARCTHAINVLRNNPGCPVWQRNYYERVIRNENELSRAREYVIGNPMKWELDRENPINAG